jgi:hypothetical protein
LSPGRLATELSFQLLPSDLADLSFAEIAGLETEKKIENTSSLSNKVDNDTLIDYGDEDDKSEQKLVIDTSYDSTANHTTDDMLRDLKPGTLATKLDLFNQESVCFKTLPTEESNVQERVIFKPHPKFNYNLKESDLKFMLNSNETEFKANYDTVIIFEIKLIIANI